MLCVYHNKLFAPVPSLFYYNWFRDQDQFCNQIVKQENGTWWLEKIIRCHGNRGWVGNLGPSGVERPRRLNLTKMTLKCLINWIPPTSLYSGYGPMPGDTATDNVTDHPTSNSYGECLSTSSLLILWIIQLDCSVARNHKCIPRSP